jgi:hypothetical protein
MCWQHSRTCTRPDDSYLRQSEQGLGVPEHLDTATKTSPKWLNMSPKAIRQLPQRQITAKASLCCSLRPAQNPITQSLPSGVDKIDSVALTSLEKDNTAFSTLDQALALSLTNGSNHKVVAVGSGSAFTAYLLVDTTSGGGTTAETAIQLGSVGQFTDVNQALAIINQTDLI